MHFLHKTLQLMHSWHSHWPADSLHMAHLLGSGSASASCIASITPSTLATNCFLYNIRSLVQEWGGALAPPWRSLSFVQDMSWLGLWLGPGLGYLGIIGSSNQTGTNTLLRLWPLCTVLYISVSSDESSPSTIGVGLCPIFLCFGACTDGPALTWWCWEEKSRNGL